MAVFIFMLICIILVYLWPNKFIGFPTVHPINADCVGYKYEKVDESGINRVYCYGIMYNYWLE